MIKNIDRDIIKLASNFSYLAINQGINLILPFVIMPYLIRIIGIEKFGIIIFAQTIMSQLYTITEYGFNITGTKQVSINRDNIDKLNQSFNEITTTKLFLTIITFAFLNLMIFLPIKEIRGEKIVFLFSFGMVIGKMLFPLWFFQGVEKMKYMTYFNLIAKIVLIVIIINFVKQRNDYIYINLFWSIGDIAVGLYSFIFIKNKFNIILKITSFKAIRKQLIDGWPMFITNISNNFYIYSNILILGFFNNAYIVGLYAIAERIMFMGKQIASVMLQATYPHACKLALDSTEKLLNFLKKELFIFFIFFLMLAAFLYGCADLITSIFAGKHVPLASDCLKLLSLVPLIVSLNMPAYQMLIIQDIKKGYMAIIVSGVFFNLALNLFLSSVIGAIGTCIAVISTEVLITLSFHVILFVKYSQFRLKYF